MRLRVKIKDSGELKIFQRLGFRMTVGIHEEEGGDSHDLNGELTVAQVANIQEFGAGDVPARSWLRRWAQKYQAMVVKMLRAELTKMAKKQDYDLRPLEPIANIATSTMRQQFVGGEIRPLNAPSTLARKAPETRPLIWTGQMTRSIFSKLRATYSGKTSGRAVKVTQTYKSGSRGVNP